MKPALPFFLLLASVSWVTLVAQGSPEKAMHYLEPMFNKKGLCFDRSKILGEVRSSSDPNFQDSKHSIWGKDPTTGVLEGLVLFSPNKANQRGVLVWVKEGPSGTWIHREVTSVKFAPDSTWRVWALSADSLAQYQSKNYIHPGQNTKIPPAPIEFHLDDSEDSLSNPAQIFHPRLGVALVVSWIQDDRKDPAPRGQTWATHARGESTDLPATAFKRARLVLRQSDRVWFRLDKQLYVADEGDWDSWVKTYYSDSRRPRLTFRSTRTLPLRGNVRTTATASAAPVSFPR